MRKLHLNRKISGSSSKNKKIWQPWVCILTWQQLAELSNHSSFQALQIQHNPPTGPYDAALWQVIVGVYVSKGSGSDSHHLHISRVM